MSEPTKHRRGPRLLKDSENHHHQTTNGFAPLGCLEPAAAWEQAFFQSVYLKLHQGD